MKKTVLPHSALSLCLRLRDVGARPIIVGGWVRDRCMDLPPSATKDIDIEIFQISFEVLEQIFQQEPHAAFPHFGVLRFDGIDLSLPRIERCTGTSYNDFCVQLCPDLSFEAACRRRDFTVNAVGWDPLAEKFLDPFHGIDAIKKRQLKPVSEAFLEDSYRILRAAQLISRFGFIPDPQLLAWGKCMIYTRLSKTHILNTKCILESAPYPEAAFEFLKKIRWQPIINALRG